MDSYENEASKFAAQRTKLNTVDDPINALCNRSGY